MKRVKLTLTVIVDCRDDSDQTAPHMAKGYLETLCESGVIDDATPRDEVADTYFIREIELDDFETVEIPPDATGSEPGQASAEQGEEVEEDDDPCWDCKGVVDQDFHLCTACEAKRDMEGAARDAIVAAESHPAGNAQ